MTIVTDTPPPIPVRPTGCAWIPADTSESDWSVAVIVAVVIVVVALVVVVDGVGIGRHGWNNKGSGVGLGRYQWNNHGSQHSPTYSSRTQQTPMDYSEF